MSSCSIFQVCNLLGEILKETVSRDSAELFVRRFYDGDCPCFLYIKEVFL